MRVIIDRIEEGIAVAECDGELVRLPAAILDGAVEGDLLEIRVIGRAKEAEDTEKPHDIFERLRRKSRPRKREAEE